MPLSDIWVLYDHPKDYPQHYVARKWVHFDNNTDYTPTKDVMVSDDLMVLRTALNSRGFVQTTRQPGDEPQIMEVWI